MNSHLNPLAKVFKTVGHLLSNETRTGKAFAAWERWSTERMNHLATNDRFLHRVGKNMERTFTTQKHINSLLERSWQLWRLPALSDVSNVRSELRHLNDQVEALSSQLEFLLARVEALKNAPDMASQHGAQREVNS